MSDTTELRAAFEKWAKDRGYQRDELDRCRTGIVGPAYYNLNTEMAWSAYQAAHASATHQNEGLRKDAARYRWLRESDGFSAAGAHPMADQPPSCVYGKFDTDRHVNRSIRGAKLDVAIDAALSVAGGRETCQCEACRPVTMADPGSMRMILCATCGNKRWPHATDHRNACTNSNAAGQPGSSWEHIHPAPALGGGEVAKQ